jgi:hypothetical protein
LANRVVETYREVQQKLEKEGKAEATVRLVFARVVFSLLMSNVREPTRERNL